MYWRAKAREIIDEALVTAEAKNKHYKVVYLDYDYANSNYHTKKGEVTKEVLVINY